MTSQKAARLAGGQAGVPQKPLWKRVARNYDLYLFLLPGLLWYLIFTYGPLYGVQIAFKDFNGGLGIWGSPWVGLKHFTRFITSYTFPNLLKNTLWLSVYSLLAGFPFPILLALMLNEVKNVRYKKLVQTVTYAPHFISMVVMVGILTLFFSPSMGVVNSVLKTLGFPAKSFLTQAGLFRHMYVWSGVWQGMGWGSIIYLAALSGVDPQQHEAAVIDGASRLQRIWYINLPVLLPTITILLILNCGSILSVGYEKVLLMQNDLVLDVSEVISTYVYKRGLLKAEYSFSAAVGLFNNVVNVAILLAVNGVTRKVGQTSLF